MHLCKCSFVKYKVIFLYSQKVLPQSFCDLEDDIYNVMDLDVLKFVGFVLSLHSFVPNFFKDFLDTVLQRILDLKTNVSF